MAGMEEEGSELGFGFRVGHWTDEAGRTGCTVVLPPLGNVTSCDIRGSSPSSRELTHLDTQRKLTEVHAILLTGGSAFGLAAADGVMTWLAEREIGYQTPIARVPIVPAAVIFDLGAGSPDARPGASQGRAACEAATEGPVARGLVGAGTGATVGKWAGFGGAQPGGLGVGRASYGTAEVSALAVVNPVGDVISETGEVLRGTTLPEPRELFPERPPPGTNTVLVVLAMRATYDKATVQWLASRGSDGIARAVRPAHTRYDGDVVFATAVPPEPGVPEPRLDVMAHLATEAVAAAVRDAVLVTPTG
ncbi:MAG TPA: P1 family peptidase [Actinomycetota bacterium]|nr:P1 family peptidase [Actinomycetota bacterium]